MSIIYCAVGSAVIFKGILPLCYNDRRDEAVSTISGKVGFKTMLHFVIMCLIMYVIAIMNPIAPLTSAGMHMLGVLAGCIYGWMTIG